VVADGQELPFKEGSFDAVICQLGLQFFPDPAVGLKAADAKGMWRQYYQRWSEFTRERLPPHFLALLPELAELVPPAQVVDKHFYSPFAEPRLHQSLQDRKIKSIVVTGGETDVCVLAAVLDAVDLGYRVIVASDALCSVS
jgi:nicotinamidase-related amidase